jgi:hypothetical protein
MKKICTILSIAAFSLALGSCSSSHCDITITPETTQAQIDSLTAALKQENIYLNITKAEYTNGKLTKLQGSVNVHDPKGTPSATFSSDSLKSYEIKVSGSPTSLMVSGK